MKSDIASLQGWLFAEVSKPLVDRTNVEQVCDALKGELPTVYARLMADLAFLPLTDLLPLAVRALCVPAQHRIWFEGVVRTLHARSRAIV